MPKSALTLVDVGNNGVILGAKPGHSRNWADPPAIATHHLYCKGAPILATTLLYGQ